MLNIPKDKKKAFTQVQIFNMFVEKIFNDYPEIQWFADQQVSATNEGTVNDSSYENSWTKLLSSKLCLGDKPEKYKYIELERTLHSIVCFKLLENGSDQAYEYWIQNQKEPKLTRENFDRLHNLTKKCFTDDLDVQFNSKIIEVCLIYSDLGKTKKFKDLMAQKNLFQTDHDDLILALCNSSQAIQEELLPSFARLNEEVKKGFLNLHIYMPLQWGNIIQLEGGPKMFNALLEILNNKDSNINMSRILHQNFLINVADVAGAMAHVIPEGAVTFNNHTYTGFVCVLDSIEKLLVHHVPEITINQLIENKKNQLGYKKSTTYLNEDQSFVLARIGCFLRLYNELEGTLLYNAAQTYLEDHQWKLVIEIFGLKSGINIWKRNPTYMPAVLLNLFSSSQDINTKYERAINGVITLAKICSEIIDDSEYHRNIEPVSFNLIAAQAKEDPDLFSPNKEIKLDYTAFPNIKIIPPPTLKLKHQL